MKSKGLSSRITRLERRSGGGECQGCNDLASARMLKEFKRTARTNLQDVPSELIALEGWLNSEDGNSDLERCPDCGESNPQVTLRYLRSFVGQ
jgi:hypothetical protein